MGCTAPKSGNSGVDDVARGVEIRLAGAQADHILALRLELLGAVGHGEGRGGFDALHAAG